MHAPLLIDLPSAELGRDERELLQHPGVAGVCLFRRNLRGVQQGREFVEAILEAAGRPLIVAIDQEGGGVVRLDEVSAPPSPMALGAADDTELSERVALACARGVRRIGVNVDFAPVADVQSNPANPVIGDRAFGADPHHVARHVAAFVRGLQAGGVAATLKHFPGHGDVSVDSHLALPRLDADQARLSTLEWPPFEAGIAVGAAAVMSGHLLVPALDAEHPATLSRATLEGVLRGALGFEGVLFSDALDMRAIAERYGVAEGAVLALAAGIDVPVVANRSPAEHHEVLAALERASVEGRIDPDRLRAANARVAALLHAYPNGAHEPCTDALTRDAAAEDEAARRAITAVGAPPRLTPGGGPLALFGRRAAAQVAASDAARPVAALHDALRARGFDVRWVDDAADLDGALSDAQALLVATSEGTPLDAAAAERYRAASARARAAGVAVLHLALRNPAHARVLDAPALLSYGARPSSLAALCDALKGAPTTGVAPVPIGAAGSA